MAITVLQPNTIWLGGPRTDVADLVCGSGGSIGSVICPGMLIERYNPSGTFIRFRPHNTASVATERMLAIEASELNKGVNDGYAIGDIVRAVQGAGGTSFWGLIASGQNITAGQKLESNGDGTLKAYATLGAAIFSALESINNTSGWAGPGTPSSPNPPAQTGGAAALPAGVARIRIEVV